MQEYKDKDELTTAYGKHAAPQILARAESNDVSNLEDAAKLGKVRGEMVMRYLPNLYRGGSVIPHFGYSIERINAGNVSREKAGNPQDVPSK